MPTPLTSRPEEGGEAREAKKCDCLKQLNAQLPDGLRIVTHMRFGYEDGENGRRAVFSGPFPTIATYKPEAKRKSKTPDFTPTFCPFCGVKYPTFNDEASS